MIAIMRAGLAMTVIAWTLVTPAGPLADQISGSLPDRLSDSEFWALSESLSEPAGVFQSDNLVSNEPGFQKVLPALTERVPAGGVYLGVGPEQNFTYIAALKPRIAFILDIRRGNRHLHLMYKALFELAQDRADFVSLLFSRARPQGLSSRSSVAEIFSAFESVIPTEPQFRDTFSRIIDRLGKTHQLPLSRDEVNGIEYVFGNFRRFGPDIAYDLKEGRSRSEFTTMLNGDYRLLMQATDAGAEPRSYLASESFFETVKALQSKNLVVPVVGDFAGSKALLAIGDWLRARTAIVSAFYVSNVEPYLRLNHSWNAFCKNTAALPFDDRSVFIRHELATLQPPTTGAHGRMFTRSDGTRAVRVTYVDGTTRELPESDAMREISGISAPIPNQLGSMAHDVKQCRGRD